MILKCSVDSDGMLGWNSDGSAGVCGRIPLYHIASLLQVTALSRLSGEGKRGKEKSGKVLSLFVYVHREEAGRNDKTKIKESNPMSRMLCAYCVNGSATEVGLELHGPILLATVDDSLACFFVQ